MPLNTSSYDQGTGVLSASRQGDALGGYEGDVADGGGNYGGGGGILSTILAERRRKEEMAMREQRRQEGLRAQEQANALQRQQAAERQARQDAASQQNQGQERERGARMAHVKANMQRASRYGGNPFDAAVHAQTGFDKMLLGVPGGYS
jgi:hypothetical protein